MRQPVRNKASTFVCALANPNRATTIVTTVAQRRVIIRTILPPLAETLRLFTGKLVRIEYTARAYHASSIRRMRSAIIVRRTL
jgi:hypothetical protein